MKALAKQMLNWANAEKATHAVIVIASEKIDDKKADGILCIGGTNENLVLGLKAALKEESALKGALAEAVKQLTIDEALDRLLAETDDDPDTETAKTQKQ
jgi:hypothetical protein